MRSPSVLLSSLFFAASLVSASSSINARSVHPQIARGGENEVEMVSSAWYASWHANDFTLDDVPWDKYTHLTFAFKESTPDPSNITMSLNDSLLLYQFVARARQNDVKALLSLGGWAGSLYFSTNVGDAKNRTKLVNAVNELVTLYQLDGIDIDWEYPGHQGIGCNTISPNDTANLLSFLQELRSSPCGSNLILTAAVSLTPFANTTDLPSTSVSEFAKVLDYIAIMNYDVWGSWSTSVGPNAPLNDTCASPENQQGSAVSAVAAWTAAGMPPSQIALGVASYGHSFSVNASSAFNGTNSKIELAPYPAFNASDFPVGDAWDDSPTVDACGVLESQGGTQDFWNLIDSGMIHKDGTPASGVPYRFDNCSQTEYVYNTTASVMISYDGPKAFIAKGNFIKNTGLRGFAMWEAGGDKDDDILLDAIRSAAGFDDCDD